MPGRAKKKLFSYDEDIEIIDDYDGFLDDDEETLVTAFLLVPLGEEDLELLKANRETKGEPLSEVAYRYLFEEDHILGEDDEEDDEDDEGDLEAWEGADAIQIISPGTAIINGVRRRVGEAGVEMLRQIQESMASMPEEKRIELWKNTHHLIKTYGAGAFFREFAKFAGGRAVETIIKGMSNKVTDNPPNTPPPSAKKPAKIAANKRLPAGKKKK